MALEYIEPRGLVVAPEALAMPRAKALAQALQRGYVNYAALIECRVSAGPPKEETVVIDVEVERSQVRQHAISRVERIGVVFEADDAMPEVLAMRKGFPIVPHLNLRSKGSPPSLCLYEEAWPEVKRSWSPFRFIERLRQWLSETSRGVLHREDQPLEPILFGSGCKIVLPHDLFSEDREQHSFLEVTLIGKDHARVFIATRAEKGKIKGLKFLAIPLRCGRQEHGRIRHTPANLAELHAMVAETGFDLLSELRKQMVQFGSSAFLQARFMLVVAFPKTRHASGQVEATDTWAFVSTKTIAEVGERIGRWTMNNGSPGMLIECDVTRTGEGVDLDVLSPVYSLSRNTAAILNGYAKADDRRMVAVGVGALGSQVLGNLTRGGFGDWAIIDDDHILPHNLARHALSGHCVGYEKALGTGIFFGSLFDGTAEPLAIHANILSPGEAKEQVRKTLSEAALILDMSASVAVARHLARDVASEARRASLFLNPAGTGLVLLIEDQGREVPLDMLEMQYYRAVLNRRSLETHLRAPEARIRYARSCRDVTSTMPQDAVATLSGIGSRAIRYASQRDASAIEIYHFDLALLTVDVTKITVEPVTSLKSGDWTLWTDRGLARKLLALRATKLPNETGGVLLGSVDLSRRIVYVVDALPSPPDSREWPTLYIRGSQQLRENIARVQERTAGHVEYVGEWHSHPRGANTRPSGDDLNVFGWLTEAMDQAGLPALMAIVADGGPTLFLGQMVQGD